MRKSLDEAIAAAIREGENRFGPTASQEIKAAIEKKLGDALSRWALEKMGTRRGDYIKAGMQNFLALAVQEILETGCDEATAVKSMPYLIPLSLGKRPLPLEQFRQLGVTVSTKYYSLLGSIDRLKAKTKSGAAFRLHLTDLLPGTRNDWIKTLEKSEEPSDIAAQYLVSKYKLTFGAEALKKWLGTIADVKKRQRWLEKRLVTMSFTKESQRRLKKYRVRDLP